MSMILTPSADSTTDDKNGKGFLARREDNKRKKELAAWVDSQYQKCKAARLEVERQWYYNIEMYLGNQWVVWSQVSGAGKLVTPKTPPWRTRLVVNRIRPIIRTELSRVTSQRPSASVVPASSEDDDLFAAQAAEQTWDHIYRTHKIKTRFRRAAWWTLMTGVGYLKCYWDPEKLDAKNKVKGSHCIEEVTPFHIFVPDLSIVEIEDQPYVIHANVLPISKVKAMYPDLGFEPTVIGNTEIIDNARLKISNNAQPDSCLVLEIWLKPGAHKDFPQGGLIRTIDNKVVYEFSERFPYSHGEFPFIKFDHIPTGKYYSESVIVDLRSLQREYNRTRSQIIESKNRMAKPQLVAPEGSVDPAKITSMPGQVILYKPGFNPPSPLPLQSLPPYVLQELDRIIMDMEDISAQHAVSKGNVPTGVTAATAISYLQERDDSVLSHTYESVEEGLEKLAGQVIALVVDYWDTPRLIRVTGTDGSFDALSLKGSDIASGTDIHVEGGSSLPTSKAAKQAFIMDLMKMGFIPPEKGLEVMEIGGVQRLYEELKVDQRQAQRENMRMANYDEKKLVMEQQAADQFMAMQQDMEAAVAEQTSVIPPELMGDLMPQEGGEPGNLSLAGQDPTAMMQQMPGTGTDQATGQPLLPGPAVPVNTWDNHAVHIDVHDRYRKSQSFELLSEAKKRLFEEHVQLHRDAMAAANPMAAMMGGMGVPPEMGGGEQMPPLPGMEGMI